MDEEIELEEVNVLEPTLFEIVSEKSKLHIMFCFSWIFLEDFVEEIINRLRSN